MATTSVTIRDAWRMLSRATLVAVCSSIFVACGSANPNAGAINIDQYVVEPSATGDQYVISIGDVLSILVFDQPSMSGSMRVRSDGRISVPLLNDVVAAGKTPTQLAADLETSLKTLILTPRVTVSITESSPLKITVLGEVGKPGAQDLRPGAGVAEALANAGGLSPFAHKDRIFVVRSDPKPVRLHFTYDALTHAVGKAAAFKLRAGDVVIVE
jgi:polysaccharide export outer membrane protein